MSHFEFTVKGKSSPALVCGCPVSHTLPSHIFIVAVGLFEDFFLWVACWFWFGFFGGFFGSCFFLLVCCFFFNSKNSQNINEIILALIDTHSLLLLLLPVDLPLGGKVVSVKCFTK